MGVDVTTSGARIEYDCAHGTIDQPMVLDSRGYFDVKGTHVKERGGPEREGESSGGQPARYTGRIQDQTMTIKVALADAKDTVGTFTLTYGKAPLITKCL